MPPWLPKTRLYVGLQRWGVQAAAAVIEARVAERGGNPRDETVEERAARFARAADLRQRQETVSAKRSRRECSASSIRAILGRDRRKVPGDLSNWYYKLEAKRSQRYRILSGLYPCNTICSFQPHYSNSLNDALLHVDIYKGFPTLPGIIGSAREPKKLKSQRYGYQLLRPDYHAWVGIDENGREFTPEQLADHILRTYMDIAERTKPN